MRQEGSVPASGVRSDGAKYTRVIRILTEIALSFILMRLNVGTSVKWA